eukprot:5803541-Amphidinium_carterae.1
MVMGPIRICSKMFGTRCPSPACSHIGAKSRHKAPSAMDGPNEAPSYLHTIFPKVHPQDFILATM